MNRLLIGSRGLLLVLGSSVLPWVADAQDKDVPPPKAPFVIAADESASWKMTFSKPKNAIDSPPETKASGSIKGPAGEGYVRAVDVVKSGNLRKETTNWSNGAVTEAWVVGAFNVFENQSKNMVIMQVPAPGKDSNDGKPEFPLFGWIGMQNYKDVEVVDGKQYYVYKQTVPLTQAVAGYFAQVPGMVSQASAFVSVETGLPSQVQVNEVNVTYTFGPGPSSPLSLPSKFQSALEQYQNKARQLNHLPSSP